MREIESLALSNAHKCICVRKLQIINFFSRRAHKHKIAATFIARFHRTLINAQFNHSRIELQPKQDKSGEGNKNSNVPEK